MDVQTIRKDFPILGRRINGRPLVYLDNAATSQKPVQVIDAISAYYGLYNANVHRGLHTLSEEATVAFEEAREKVARFIGASDPSCLVFTRNTTESINLVAYGWARKNLKPGDVIVVSHLEHHSNLIPWQMVARDTGATVRFILLTPEGTFDMDSLDEALQDGARLVSVSQMSNALGTINPVEEVARRAHEAGALVLVDGAQGAPHLKTDIRAMGCDFYAFSAHKMCGPTGIGALYGHPALLESMEPFLGGGDMISHVWFDRATWNEVPYKFEAGTPDIAGAIGFGAAVDYLNALDMEAVCDHEQELTAYAVNALSEVEGIRIYGPKDTRLRGGVISFNLEGVHPHDVSQILDSEGVAIRAGHHCCEPLMRLMEVPGTARASFYLYNTYEESDALVQALHSVRKVFHHVASGRPLP
ncbi:MAG: cysteine desulfurase [Armatimonadetes bacterium]|nr:cysteine desulfurase [Armatimonadota bacterium]